MELPRTFIIKAIRRLNRTIRSGLSSSSFRFQFYSIVIDYGAHQDRIASWISGCVMARPRNGLITDFIVRLRKQGNGTQSKVSLSSMKHRETTSLTGCIMLLLPKMALTLQMSS